MAEGARLESVFRGNSNVGSNPTLSAKFKAVISPCRFDILELIDFTKQASTLHFVRQRHSFLKGNA